MSEQDHILEVRNLAAGYPGQTVLQNVNFTLDRGEILAIIGQNGSGKSTLLKTLCGLLPIKSGNVLFNGQSLKSIAPHELIKKGISYVAQGGLIIPALTIREHLELVLLHENKHMKKTKIEETFTEFSRLESISGKLAGNLSGGERQLLSMAVLQMQGTNTWLLDEPTAGLAPDMVHFTIDFLQRMNQIKKVNMLLIEHNIDVAFKLASKLVSIKDRSLTQLYESNKISKEDFLYKFVYN